jgi:glycosyltransferase involved in cell wall biosynthesis
MDISEKVSVLIAFYNAKETICRTLKSVINQSYPNFEIILIDDASDDGSTEIIVRLMSDLGFSDYTILRNERNMGLTLSLNLGLSICTGFYVARLDADDEWKFNKLEKQIGYMREQALAWSCTRFLRFENGVTSVMSSELKDFPYSNPFIHSSLLITRDIIELVGKYDKRFKYSQDYYLYANLYRHKVYGGIVDDILGVRYVSENVIGVKRRRQQIYYLVRGQLFCLFAGIGQRPRLILAICKNILRVILNQKSIDVFKNLWRFKIANYWNKF